MAQVIHAGIVCDECKITPIVGTRYKCLNCKDFDLCEQCEARDTHDNTHIFAKIRRPLALQTEIGVPVQPSNHRGLFVFGPNIQDRHPQTPLELVWVGNEVGIKVLKDIITVEPRAGNVCISPFSVTMILLLVAHATSSDSLHEIMHFLGYQEKNYAVNRVFQAYLKELLANNHELFIANSVHLPRCDLPSFLACAGCYNATAICPSNETRAHEWVAQSTDRKVTSVPIFSQNDFASALVNVMYFNGVWQKEFTQYEMGDFHGIVLLRCRYMSLTSDTFQYFKEPGVEAISWPYMGTMKAVVLLPDSTASAVDYFNYINYIVMQMKTIPGTLIMPSFSFECEVSLKSSFQRLGINAPFNNFHANQSNLININQLTHKTSIVWDEKGAPPKHSMAQPTSTMEPRFKMIVNRSFLFLVHDTNNVILYIGMVADPRPNGRTYLTNPAQE